MKRGLSLAALSTMLLATAVEAHSDTSLDAAYLGDAKDERPQSALVLIATNTRAVGDHLGGDHCGVEGYSWLTADGQPINGS